METVEVLVCLCTTAVNETWQLFDETWQLFQIFCFFSPSLDPCHLVALPTCIVLLLLLEGSNEKASMTNCVVGQECGVELCTVS